MCQCAGFSCKREKLPAPHINLLQLPPTESPPSTPPHCGACHHERLVIIYTIRYGWAGGDHAKRRLQNGRLRRATTPRRLQGGLHGANAQGSRLTLRVDDADNSRASSRAGRKQTNNLQLVFTNNRPKAPVRQSDIRGCRFFKYRGADAHRRRRRYTRARAEEEADPDG